MPMQRGMENGKHWVRWGNKGTKRFYKEGDEKSLETAKRLVAKDRKRIEAFANR